MKVVDQDCFPSPPFPPSGQFAWQADWEELKLAGYELHCETEILDDAIYPDDPDSQGVSYSIKKGDFEGNFKEAIAHHYGNREAHLLFSQWVLAIDCLELSRIEAWLKGERNCVNFHFGIKERWANNIFMESACLPLVASKQDYPHLGWIEYELYMQAQLLKAVPGELGALLVKFPPDGAEDNRLHTHPCSDRIITVMSGSGEFVRSMRGEIETFPLVPGDRVWMPRGILHTFRAGGEGLLVESLHSPFLSFDDPKCLAYPGRFVSSAPE